MVLTLKDYTFVLCTEDWESSLQL